jgi:hypothetical protein
MKRWLNVDTTTGKVLGWQGTGAEELPVAPSGVRQVERTDGEMDSYFALTAQAASEKRSPEITESGGSLTLASDARIYLDVAVDNAEPAIDVDTVTFTIKKLNSDDTINTSFSGSTKFPFNDRLFKVTFVAGVATYSMKFKNSGTRVIDSTSSFKIKTPLTVDVVE